MKKLFVLLLLPVAAAFGLNFADVDYLQIDGNDVTSIEIGGETVWTKSWPTRFEFSDGTFVETDIRGQLPATYRNNQLITNVVMGKRVTSLTNYVFDGCSNLASVTFGPNVATLAPFSFRNCKKLKNLAILCKATSIPNNFAESSGITNVVFGPSVRTFAGYSFATCKSLASVYLPETVRSIAGSSVFNQQSSALKNVVIEEGLTNMAANTFIFCYGLTNVVLPNSLRYIGYHSFMDDKALRSVEIGNGAGDHVNSPQAFSTNLFDGSAFLNTTGSNSVTIGNGVVDLGLNAFPNADNRPRTIKYYNRATETKDEAEARAKAIVSVTGKDLSQIAEWVYVPYNPYVTNGLIAMWDGRWNAGWGAHDSAAAAWVNLCGGPDFEWEAGTAGISWSDDHVNLANGNKSTVNLASCTVPVPENTTVEIVVKADWVFSDNYGNIQTPIRWYGSAVPNSRYRGTAATAPGWSVYGTTAQRSFAAMGYAGADPANVASLSVHGPVSALGPHDLYLNGVAQTINVNYSYDNSFDVGTVWLCRAPRADTSLYCIRFYNRHLTDEEIAHNAAIDALRFYEGN